MSVALSQRPSLKWKKALPWVGMGACLALFAGHLWRDRLLKASPARSEVTAPAATAATSGLPSTVTLSEGKFKASKIATEPARVVSMASEVAVSGWVEANADHKVEIRPRASGVIREVHALLGQRVKKGDVMIVLDSAEVGTARLNLRAKQRELAIARTEAEWKDEVATNVSVIIPKLRQGVTAAKLEVEFADRPLGSNRALLLQAYSELEIASHEEIKQSELLKQKIVGEHPAFLAAHVREGAQARFEAALEQVRFDAAQQKRLADQQSKLAESAVIDAAQRLRILGVSEDINGLLSQSPKASIGSIDEDVTAYEIVAPFSGTIIAKAAVPSQKAEVNDVLFSLADLTTVWIMANITESDFAALPDLQNGLIRFTATAYPGKTFQAKLLSVGSVVDPTTRTVPLMAETPNADGLLKLGLFVRIVLDSARREESLTVPVSAVVEIEEHQGVFVPTGTDGRTFAFQRVKLGRETGDRQVVKSGLAEGEAVVSKGAFLLKSELILQSETEED